jgi:hypothetical protein
VFADRFHDRELRTPRDVRNALVYVLQNLRKHGIAVAGPDPYSSGPEFDGWTATELRVGTQRVGLRRRPGLGRADSTARRGAPRIGGDLGSHAARGGGGGPCGQPFLRADRADCPRAQTWLLGVGWQRHGLIDMSEAPRRLG